MEELQNGKECSKSVYEPMLIIFGYTSTQIGVVQQSREDWKN